MLKNIITLFSSINLFDGLGINWFSGLSQFMTHDAVWRLPGLNVGRNCAQRIGKNTFHWQWLLAVTVSLALQANILHTEHCQLSRDKHYQCRIHARNDLWKLCRGESNWKTGLWCRRPACSSWGYPWLDLGIFLPVMFDRSHWLLEKANGPWMEEIVDR